MSQDRSSGVCTSGRKPAEEGKRDVEIKSVRKQKGPPGISKLAAPPLQRSAKGNFSPDVSWRSEIPDISSARNWRANTNTGQVSDGMPDAFLLGPSTVLDAC